ncbi:MAG: TIGR00269 family protein [Methanomassiliicoccales archaeon]|nr:TIGR00269 family protein [Methanomassiliicoccales archaeon]
MRCSKCSATAVTYVRYNGAHLCLGHFQEYVEKRVKREVRSQLRLEGEVHIGVGASGGKDSQLALFLLHKILGCRQGVRITAITVDEGIEGYRRDTIPKVRELCSALGLEHAVVSFEEVATMTLDQMVLRTGEKEACTYCGVFRRRCLNLKAKQLGVDVLALGHNLDDMAQSILMNFMRGDVERLARLGPHERVQPGLVPRIQPLRLIPEKETYLYALLSELPFSDAECPYAKHALRNEYRNMVSDMERKHPGTRHSILGSYDRLRPLMRNGFPQAMLGKCPCGEPTLSERCMACEMIERLRNATVGDGQ